MFPGYPKALKGKTDGTYGEAILETLFAQWGADRREDEAIFAYLEWKLSTDDDDDKAPEQSRADQDPARISAAAAKWLDGEQSADRAGEDVAGIGCELEICQKMERRLRYGLDLVVTERGFLGLTNRGEAEVGMTLALLQGASELSLLRERRDEGEERWFECVDKIFVTHLTDRVKSLEQLVDSTNATVERFEIR